MKRPEGFDHSEPEPPEAPGKRPGASRAIPRRQKSTGASPARESPAAEKPNGGGDARPTPLLPPSTREKPTREKPVREKPVRAERVRESPRDEDPRRAERRAARARKHEAKVQARRFTRHSRRRRATWISLGAIVVVLVAVLAIAVYSPLLALRTIKVEGTSKVSPAEVKSALDGQLGTPLALLDFSRIRSQLSHFTLVRSYATETVPPSTLVIHIVEREPIAVVANGDGYNRVDAAGVVLSTTPKRGSLPIIDVGGLPATSGAFKSVASVILAMPKSVKTVVKTVSATTADDVRLSLTNATQTVVWGSSSDSTLKAESLAAMLKQSVCKSEPVIDVSAPLAPICGPNRFAQKPKATHTSTPTATSTALPSD